MQTVKWELIGVGNKEHTAVDYPVTQYLMPHGETRETHVNLPDEVYSVAMKLGVQLSAELLMTGPVAVYGTLASWPEENELCELAVNGPGPNSPENKMIEIIRKIAERET